MAKRRYTLVDMYKEGTAPENVTLKRYKLIFKTFIDKVFKKVLEKGEAFKLPRYLGVIQVRKKRAFKKKSVDFYNTKKYGMVIYHNNRHSDSYHAFFHWDKDYPYGRLRNKKMWKLVCTRNNKRTLARHIKDNNSINLYYEI